MHAHRGSPSKGLLVCNNFRFIRFRRLRASGLVSRRCMTRGPAPFRGFGFPVGSFCGVKLNLGEAWARTYFESTDKPDRKKQCEREKTQVPHTALVMKNSCLGCFRPALCACFDGTCSIVAKHPSTPKALDKSPVSFGVRELGRLWGRAHSG